jgi:hypothetical protein
VSDTLIVAAISAMVLQILDADQSNEFAVPVAPLTEGRVLLGREFLKNRTSPSRIVMVPVSSAFGPPATKSNQVVQSGVKPGFKSRIFQRPLATDRAMYEVYCWGQSNLADPEKDFDATRYLAHVVMQAAQLVAMTSVRIDGHGEWTDQRSNAPQILKAGHEFMFTMSIDVPVLDSSVQPAPPLTAVPTVAVS